VGVSKNHPLFGEGGVEFRSLAWGKTLTVDLCYSKGNSTHAVLYTSKGETDPGKSVNAALLKKGHAKLDKQVPLPESYSIFQKIEGFAKEKKLKIWNFDDEDEEE